MTPPDAIGAAVTVTLCGDWKPVTGYRGSRPCPAGSPEADQWSLFDVLGIQDFSSPDLSSLAF